MKKLLLAGIAVAALSLTALTPAEASGGCGPYRHRGWDGFCRPGGQLGFAPHPVYFGGYGWHRPWGPGYGWHRPGWGWRHRW